jgi:CheY-like chemotaxis protein
VHTGPYTAVREIALTRFDQGWKTEQFEVGVGKPNREGFIRPLLTSAPRSGRSASGRTVLSTLSVISVVDDDASVRAATNNLLRSHGYVVHTFASAEEFLQSTHLNDMSCVIADVQMPIMSGVELLTTMRAQGYRVPFIFITAFPDDSIRARALNAGAICFMAKPFSGPTLIKCLATALEGHRGGAGE